MGEVVMFFNIFILGQRRLFLAGKGLCIPLSLNFVAYKTIDLVLEGFDESKSVMIISDQAQEISDAILHPWAEG
ncbi:MAG: YitT family protein [Bacillota bacterium]|nr:YitT family protein [Desulforamulus profundi]